MFWKYLKRVWSNFWSLIIATVSTAITFAAVLVDLRVDVVNLTPLAWLGLAVFWGVSIFLSGFLVWRNDFKEYHRTEPEIRLNDSSFTLTQWLDLEQKTGFFVTETIVASVSASVRIFNPRRRLIHLQTRIATVRSNWTVLETPGKPRVIHPHRAGQYPDGIIGVEAEGTVPVSISFDIHFAPAMDEDEKSYLECLKELVIILEFEAQNRKPASLQITPEPADVHEQVRKRIASLMDHELVKRNHWREQGLELFAKYQKGC